MIGRITVAAIALAAMSGCASSGLVHDKNYLRAAHISRGENVRLTLAYFGEQSPVTAEGSDIRSALELAEIYTGKPIFTGYTELISVSGSDCTDTLEYALNTWKVSPDCIIAHSGNGNELLPDGAAERLHGSVREAVKQGKLPDCGLMNVLEELLYEGKAEVAELLPTGGVSRTYLITDTGKLISG